MMLGCLTRGLVCSQCPQPEARSSLRGPEGSGASCSRPSTLLSTVMPRNVPPEPLQPRADSSSLQGHSGQARGSGLWEVPGSFWRLGARGLLGGEATPYPVDAEGLGSIPPWWEDLEGSGEFDII